MALCGSRVVLGLFGFVLHYFRWSDSLFWVVLGGYRLFQIVSGVVLGDIAVVLGRSTWI